MPVPSLADDTAASKCIKCGAAVSSKAKFCEECGAIQVAPLTSSRGSAGEMSLDSTVSGIEAQPPATPQLPSTAANQTSNPAGDVGEGSSTQKKHLRIYGFA